jgi:hypothetical protein
MSTMVYETKDVLTRIEGQLKLQNSMKRDFIAPAKTITYSENHLFLTGERTTDVEAYQVTDFCHEQIAEKLDIPLKYYKKMKAKRPALFEENINAWLREDGVSKYLLRCLKDDTQSIARAFLSNSYNCIDNYDVLYAALDAISRMRVKVEILKAEVTEKRMYLQVVCPEVEIQAEAFLKDYMRKGNNGVGYGIMSGFSLANSEIGCGKFEIMSRAVAPICNNGLTIKDDSFSKIHLGERLAPGEIIWSERTKQKNYELIISQVQDAVATFLNKDYLGKMVERVAATRNIKLEYPADAVKNVCKELAIPEEHRKNIMNYFLHDGVHDASGILHAVTRESQNMHADLQYDVESTIIGHVEKISKFDKPYSEKKFNAKDN